MRVEEGTGKAPRFISTRAGSARDAVSFREALLRGIAPDGGLYVPTSIPHLFDEFPPDEDISRTGFRMLHRWIGREIDSDTLSAIVTDALDFPAPLVPLGDTQDGLFLLELFHGPTLSFKDFGARTMARLLSHFLAESGEELTILVATSGDTGSAVADGFAGQGNIRVVLLYPKDRISAVQERQLIVERPGVTALAVEGTFDDCQRMAKEAFADAELKTLRLSSANSINIGRLLPQSVYYAHAAVQPGREPIFCVPSGNLGNLTAGVLACLGGMPAARFIAAHNANDFFPRLLSGEEATMGATRQTLSNAMDVGTPSNFERLQHLLSEAEMRRLIWGTSVDDDGTRARMKQIFETAGYVADPHTAVGVEAALRYRAATGDDAPIIVLSTAHPAKFPDIVADAIGAEPPRAPALDALWERGTRCRDIAPTIESLREVLLEA